MVLDHQGEHATQWATICSIAAKIGGSGETLRKWVRQAERDPGSRAVPGHPPGVRRDLCRLRRSQNVAADAAVGDRGGALHCGQADAPDGAQRRRAEQGGEDHDWQQGDTLSARSGQPTVSGASAEPAVAQRLHLRLDLAGLCLRGVYYRRVRPAYRRLAGVAPCQDGLRARCVATTS